MTRYAVGDIQGCLHPLQCLLEKVGFDQHSDELWLVGDLVNRGPDSLGTLRFIKSLGDCTTVVLGNHDLHFLAIAYGKQQAGKHDTFNEILNADDKAELIDWLRHQPLFHLDPSGDYAMVHAGIPPIWDIKTTAKLAKEVEQVLHGDRADEFFAQMYGNQPNRWDDSLSGFDRYRTITNYLTRMRFCTQRGELEFKNKGLEFENIGTEGHCGEFAPWFSFPGKLNESTTLIVGHWANLQGRTDRDNVVALDTGCVWGRSMTLYNLETRIRLSCECSD